MSCFIVDRPTLQGEEALKTTMTVESPTAPAGVIPGTEIASFKDPDLARGIQHSTPNAQGSSPVSFFEDVRSSMASPTSVTKQAEQAMRRHTIAQWIFEMTSQNVPCRTDQEFRACLRDGVLLCKVLNTIKPGTITQVCSLLSS